MRKDLARLLRVSQVGVSGDFANAASWFFCVRGALLLFATRGCCAGTYARQVEARAVCPGLASSATGRCWR